MFDFKIQEEMLCVSLDLLEHGDVIDVYALGGGTALSAFYWEHRFSTDIDIFIYSKDRKILHKIDPRYTSKSIKKKLKDLNYTGDLKNNGVYMELAIDDDKKMQFFPAKPFTSTPYKKGILWGKEIYIESIEEIIAKKIYYRCGDGNSRDLFDIAIGICKNPAILVSINGEKKKLEILLETVNVILKDKVLMVTYNDEISMMEPAEEYKDIATNTIEFLNIFLDEYLQAIGRKMADIEEYCEDIFSLAYEEIST